MGSSLRVSLLACLAVSGVFAGVAQAAPDDTTLISRQSDSAGGTAGNGHSTDQVVSADGRYVAFTSSAVNLAGGPTMGNCDSIFNTTISQVYVRDTLTGTTTLASRATGAAGAMSNGCARDPEISADGRWVVFTSSADNLDPDVDGDRYVDETYMRDLATDTTVLVSRTDDDLPSQGDSNWPSISDDGRYVSFNSDSGPLAGEQPVASFQTYVRDLQAGTTTLASRATGVNGAPQNERTWNSGISGDGRHVVWRSWATNISNDIDGCINIFVRNLDTSTTELASRESDATGGEGANGTSSNAVISYDGRYVAFASFGDNLSNDDYDNPDRVNLDHCGNETSGDYGGDNDIFVRDMVAGKTTLVSRADGPDGAGAAPISSNAFQGYAPSYRPSISADGRFVAFLSASDNLSPYDRDDLGNDDDFQTGLDSFVRDTVAGTTKLVSRATGPSGEGANLGGAVRVAPTVSDDGLRVAFTSRATNLSEIDQDAYDDVFMREFGPAPVIGMPVSGHLLSIRDSAQSALQRRLRVQSKDPAIGATEDFTLTGATLQVAGTGLTVQTYQLPAANWRRSGSGYRYSDTALTNGPVRSASVRGKQLKVDAVAAQLPSMLGSNPAPVSIAFSNGIRQYCMQFGGTVTYKAGRLLTARKAPALGDCES